ncbi:hypothetical protein M2475_001808 [Breznakia sp. PF5-3]|uniref:hypothetical protein n=1 Tax=unclassified Breznakia TaxID=2623764 RepID=UPI0024049402|nr:MULTISPECIES: hypothetical protein [unclassified Breznakia]MDF9825353.1 hypothetical protein [Breznakia sp. PM6-1]MDF9836231.1 hypothetical protein [Breznakia sp. PF5-3]MDF9838529.1 hypothetical protein [Breznakia sp. PFB2-8]MDF9860476.1 hypothetical protein [Breznakia sp. PH5-24]
MEKLYYEENKDLESIKTIVKNQQFTSIFCAFTKLSRYRYVDRIGKKKNIVFMKSLEEREIDFKQGEDVYIIVFHKLKDIDKYFDILKQKKVSGLLVMTNEKIRDIKDGEYAFSSIYGVNYYNVDCMQVYHDANKEKSRIAYLYDQEVMGNILLDKNSEISPIVIKYEKLDGVEYQKIIYENFQKIKKEYPNFYTDGVSYLFWHSEEYQKKLEMNINKVFLMDKKYRNQIYKLFKEYAKEILQPSLTLTYENKTYVEQELVFVKEASMGKQLFVSFRLNDTHLSVGCEFDAFHSNATEIFFFRAYEFDTVNFTSITTEEKIETYKNEVKKYFECMIVQIDQMIELLNKIEDNTVYCEKAFIQA